MSPPLSAEATSFNPTAEGPSDSQKQAASPSTDASAPTPGPARPPTMAETRARMEAMGLCDDPQHPGGLDGADSDEDDDYDSDMYSTEEEDGSIFDTETPPLSDAEEEAARLSKKTPEDIALNQKVKRLAILRRAGRANIREWKPLPSACLNCFKIGTTSDGTLLQCSRCKTVKYCSGECQKAHWPKHKASCKKYAVDTSKPDEVPFHAIYQTKFLHNRPERQTYQLLIDCLRMRQEDVYALGGDTMVGTIYNQEPSSVRAFKQFLRKAKWVPKFFPPWWTEEKEKACIEYGMNDSHFSLECAQEKADIQKKWKDPQMPMKLRMVAESVYGDTPGGSSSEQVMEMMLQTERGAFKVTTLDTPAARRKR